MAERTRRVLWHGGSCPEAAVLTTHTPRMIMYSGPGTAALYAPGWRVQTHRVETLIGHGGGMPATYH